MRKFKHKTLWMIAEQNNDFSYWDYVIESIDANYSRWSKAYPDLRVVRTIPPELIENSQDRQEVIDRDWIDELHNDLFYVGKEISLGILREAIEKNAPKPKKFTIEYIKEWSKKHQRINTKNLEEFLQEHWLLSGDTELETSE